MLIESIQYVLNNQKGVDLLLSIIKLYNENTNCDYQLFEQIIRNIPDLDLIRPKIILGFSHKTSKLVIVTSMAEKEKEHLNWLIDNNAPKYMIETSQRYLSHFRQRHKEYIEYVEGL